MRTITVLCFGKFGVPRVHPGQLGVKWEEVASGNVDQPVSVWEIVIVAIFTVRK